jgi:hypothetical protein
MRARKITNATIVTSRLPLALLFGLTAFQFLPKPAIAQETGTEHGCFFASALAGSAVSAVLIYRLPPRDLEQAILYGAAGVLTQRYAEQVCVITAQQVAEEFSRVLGQVFIGVRFYASPWCRENAIECLRPYVDSSQQYGPGTHAFVDDAWTSVAVAFSPFMQPGGDGNTAIYVPDDLAGELANSFYRNMEGALQTYTSTYQGVN